MIRTHDIAVDYRILDPIHEIFVYAMIIDPPADVIHPRIRTIRPPCIVTGFGIEMAKRINVPGLQELGHGIAFLRIVPGIVLIRLRTRQINLSMSNIIVSAQNNVLPGLDQFVAVPFYRSDEGELVLDTLAFGLTVRNVAIHDGKVFILNRLHTTFVVKLSFPQHRDGQRLLPGIRCHAAIALFLSRSENRRVSLRRHLGVRQVGRKYSTLLQTQDIGLRRIEPFQKAFFQYRTQSIYIPGNNRCICHNAPFHLMPTARRNDNLLSAWNQRAGIGYTPGTMNVNDVIESMEQWAPASLAYSWDKIGLATGSPDQKITKVITALTITRDAFNAAKRAKAQMILSHHPLIWDPITTLRSDNPLSKLFLDIAQSGIACYSAHTNLDVAQNGVNHVLADRLGLTNKQALFKVPQARQSKLVVFVPESHFIRVREAVFVAGAGGIQDYTECSFSSHGHGTFLPHENAKPFAGRIGKLNEEPEIRFETLLPSEHTPKILHALREAHPYEEPAFDIIPLEMDNPVYSLGLRGELARPVSLDTFAKRVKQKLDISHVRVTGKGTAKVKHIAVMGGAGGDSADNIPDGVDVFVTGDVKYHKALDAADAGLKIIDAGHHGTEKWIVPAMADYLKQILGGLKVATYMEPDPFRVL